MSDLKANYLDHNQTISRLKGVQALQPLIGEGGLIAKAQNNYDLTINEPHETHSSLPNFNI